MSNIVNEGCKFEQFKVDKEIDASIFKEALSDAMVKVLVKAIRYSNVFPTAFTTNGMYSKVENVGWTEGFWTGILWFSYLYANDNRYLSAAMNQVGLLKERLENQVNVNHHDMGFLYSPSCMYAYRFYNSEEGKQTAIHAADNLMKRWLEKAEVLQSWTWGKYREAEGRGNVIIDSMMNLPLLYWASEVTGDKKYRITAEKHAEKLLPNIIRPDASTYHMFYFDLETGKPVRGETAQGYADDSCWSRGQAWAIYGSVLSYAYTKRIEFLDIAVKCANYFLNRTPEDMVVFWDFTFEDGSGHLKDSSASAICVCGLLEMIKHLEDVELIRYYKNAAMQILEQLIKEYAVKPREASDALLKHVVGSLPHNNCINESSLYGDYFYLEALMRVVCDFNIRW